MQSQYLSGFSSVDFEFLVRVILSLSAIFLAYDVISGEREAGTLRLMFSNSVKRSTLLLGKFLGGLLSLLIPLLLSFLLGLLIASFSPLIDFQSPEHGRLGFIFLLSALYLTSFFTLGIFVSTLTRRSKITLLISLLIWVFLLFIVPNASFEMAQKIKPVPSFKKMMARQTDVTVDNCDRKCNEIEFSLKERTYQQINLSRWLSGFSPASAYSHTVQTFSRTDISSYRRFLKLVYDEWNIFDSMSSSAKWKDLSFEEKHRIHVEYQNRFK